MRTILNVILSIALAHTCTAGNYDSLVNIHFSSAQLSKANTGVSTSYLSSSEKEMLQYLNLARMYPRTFATFYLDYLKTYDSYGFGEYQSRDKYYYSLYEDLNSLGKREALTSSRSMHNFARCWAKESGKRGVIGHNRRRCNKGYSAECCSYMGTSDPMSHILLLLIDEDISSLGHRKIMLDKYRSVGISIQPHKSYGRCAVLDFSWTFGDLASD